MHARVWELRIIPGKLEEFTRATRSLIPKARQQQGYRGVVILRSKEDTAERATLISVWNSLADLKASEKNLFLYEAIARIVGCCEAFPNIEEHEVLLSEFSQK